MELRYAVVSRTLEVVMNAVVRKVTRAHAPVNAEVEVDPHDFAAGLTQEQKRDGMQAARRVVASAVKSALHRIDAQAYPSVDDADSLDDRIAQAMNRLPPIAIDRLKPRVLAIGDGRRTIKALAGIDVTGFRTRVPIASVAPVGLLRAKPKAPDAEGHPRAGSGAPAKYSKATLELRAIHCIRETSGGGMDEIILGGALIGATGNVNNIDAIDAGDFDSGTYAEFGALPIGTFNLKNVERYPSYLYAIFLLVESDSDDKAVAESINDVIGTIAVIAASFYSGGLAAAAAYAIYEAVDGLISAFFGPDALRQFGIRLNLDSNDPFGKPISANLRTGNITGDGAKYRIGYRWVLSA